MKTFGFIFIFGAFCYWADSQPVFNDWFTDGSLRIDFIIAGDSTNSDFFLQSLKKEPYWAGSRTNLVDIMDYGEFRCRLFSEDGKVLIYSMGFSTLFEEWQTTLEARAVRKGFYESIILPFPLKKMLLELSWRKKGKEFEPKLTMMIDPADYFIQPSPGRKYEVKQLIAGGKPENSVDLVFVPEGYTAGQMDKFLADVNKLCDYLFNTAPYNRYPEKFNIFAVLAPSEDEGCDIPGAGIWKNTQMNSSFYTFNSERYLTTLDYWKVRDLSALAPCDHVVILVNSEKYGGGGVYNHYTLTSTDNKYSSFVFVHELGHGFGGLGDEYYTSDVAYNDFYSPAVEPWEPNLTTLVDFKAKWQDLLRPGTPVPTPALPEYLNSTGVFEGGGYVEKGVYRPAYNCIMKSSDAPGYCKVCEVSIEKMILFYSE